MAAFDYIESRDDADELIAERCRREGRALITLDLHFSDIRQYPPDQYSGLIVLRVGHQDKRHLIRVFQRVVSLLPTESPVRQQWLVDEAGVRVRGVMP